MRKDLRVPPPDVLALRAALLGGSYYLYAQYVASGLGPEGLLARAEELLGLDLQDIVSISIGIVGSAIVSSAIVLRARSQLVICHACCHLPLLLSTAAGLATGPDRDRPRLAAAPLTAPRHGCEVMVGERGTSEVAARGLVCRVPY